MSTSRETWRKVSRWNRRFLCILILLPVTGVWVPAEETAILKRGPLEIQGIDPLPRNAHPAFYGEYLYGSIVIESYFTYTSIYLPADWPRSGCSGYEIHIVPGEGDDVVFIYRDTDGWSLITRFPEPGEYCAFLGELVAKMKYFQGIYRGAGEFSFPAVLTIPD